VVSVEVLRESVFALGDVTRRIADFEAFHLDHLGAEVGHQHRGRRPLLKLGEVEHANAFEQWAGHG